MTGLLYKELKIHCKQMLLFLLGMIAYPVMMIFLITTQSEELGEECILLFGMASLIAFIVGGTFEDMLFSDDERRKWAYYVTSTPTGIKGHIGAKYLFTLLFAMFTLTLLILVNGLAMDLNDTFMNVSSIVVVFFYLQLLMRSIEFPLIVRFGGKTGGMVKVLALVAIVCAVGVYALFGDISKFGDPDKFWDWLFTTLNDPENAKKIMLWFGLATAAILPIYYISYRLSVKLYLKGAENYAK